MKFLLILILIVLSTFAHSAAFFPVGKAGVEFNTYPKYHEKKEVCEAEENHPCYDTEFCSPEICDLEDEIVDGPAIYSAKQFVTECADEMACEAYRPTLCNEEYPLFFYAENLILPGYEAYCVKITGYEQVLTGKKVLKENPVKLAAKQAADAQKAQLAAAMASAEKAMACGKSAQALLLVRNASKNLTTAQVKALVETYSPVKQLLDTGSLTTAIEEINAVVADGVVVTEADKAALVAHINACKP